MHFRAKIAMFFMDLKGNYWAYWEVNVCMYIYTMVQGMYEDLVHNLSIPTCFFDQNLASLITHVAKIGGGVPHIPRV